jgi:hypothetical protein
MLQGGAGHPDPVVRLGIGQVQDVRAVLEHRRAGESGVEVPRLDLRDVGDERRLDAARLAEQVGESGEELVVGD